MFAGMRKWLREILIRPYAARVVLDTGGDYSEQELPQVVIAPTDPLLRYFQERPEVVEVSRLNLASPDRKSVV